MNNIFRECVFYESCQPVTKNFESWGSTIAAQRKLSRFSLCSPGFKSRRSQNFSCHCLVVICDLRFNPTCSKHRILQKPIRDKVQVSTAEKYIASKIVFRAEVASPSLIYDEFFCIQNKRTFRHSGLSYHIRVKGERHPLFVSGFGFGFRLRPLFRTKEFDFFLPLLDGQ